MALEDIKSKAFILEDKVLFTTGIRKYKKEEFDMTLA